MTQSAPLTLPATTRPAHSVFAIRLPARLAHAIPLFLAVALAALLRLAGLGHDPLWGDEAATASFASLPWPDLLTGIGRLEPNPPTFYALEKLWTALAGPSDLALRLPSALCGIAAIAAIHGIARVSFGPAPPTGPPSCSQSTRNTSSTPATPAPTPPCSSASPSPPSPPRA